MQRPYEAAALRAARSISIAITRRTAWRRPRVSDPSPGPTSRTMSSLGDTGCGDDSPYGVRVGDEVLAQLLGRPQAQLACQLTDRGGIEQPAGHALAQPQLAGARRPGTPALLRLNLLGNRDLLLPAGLVRHARAAVRAPGAEAELQATVEAVAGVDRPVATGLTLGELVPDTA